MPGDQYEPNRVLGIPWTRDPNTRQDEEPQRVMVFLSTRSALSTPTGFSRWRIPSGGTGDGCGAGAWVRTRRTKMNRTLSASHR